MSRPGVVSFLSRIFVGCSFFLKCLLSFFTGKLANLDLRQNPFHPCLCPLLGGRAALRDLACQISVEGNGPQVHLF